MLKYVHTIMDFFELFEKIKFETEEYGARYTAMMFEVQDENRINEFQEFLLKYIRISDTVFSYKNSKVLLILEETTIRGAILLSEKLREKIKEKGFKYNYYCSAIQGDYIETDEKLLKSLKKRLKIAKNNNSTECIYDLSEY